MPETVVTVRTDGVARRGETLRELEEAARSGRPGRRTVGLDRAAAGGVETRTAGTVAVATTAMGAPVPVPTRAAAESRGPRVPSGPASRSAFPTPRSPRASTPGS